MTIWEVYVCIMAEESPLDRFKSALTSASRALAHEAELELTWTADAPAQVGKNLRIPMPGRGLPRDKAMEARGFADSYALRMRHHDEGLHRKSAPLDASARACFDAVETVRYEALGSRDYAGIRQNIGAAEDVRLASDPIVRATNPGEVPVQVALGLILRERLTGEPVPAVAQAGVDMVRGWIEERAGDDFDKLAASLDDQQAFQSLSLDMLRHLELVQAEPMEPETLDDDDEQEDEEGGEDEEGEQDSESGDDMRREMAGDSEDGDNSDDTDSEPDPDGEMGESDMEDEGQEGMLPVRPNRPWTDFPADFEYKIYTERFDEVVGAEELCDDEELTRLRAYLDSQLTGLQGVVSMMKNGSVTAAPSEPAET